MAMLVYQRVSLLSHPETWAENPQIHRKAASSPAEANNREE